MLAAITPVVARLTHGGAMIGTDFGPSQDEIDDMVDEAMAIIEPFGYVRAVEALLTIKQQRKPEAFKAAELDLYEELASIERTLPEGSIEDASATPLACLRLWCADTISDTLTDLRTGLEHSDRSAGMNWFPNFESLMRRAYYACENYQIETAGQLTMTLVDLVARTRSTNNAPDVILIQMARGFVETMDLVFDALIQGDKPDIARIEALFEEASNCAFAASGLVTARSIEQRLGLPKEFHRVLSPDSVKAAQSAIEEGKRFFVVRADLNKDEALAEKFLSWITAGHARMITNVTIFQDDETIFDFLMATTLEEHHVVEQLANLDPEGKNLSMTMALTVAEEVESDKKKEPEHEIDAVLTDAANGVLGAENLKVIEAIGEISAGQAMIDHALSEMVEMDLMHDLTARMRANGIDEIHPRMKGVMRETFEHYLGQLRQIKEAGAQVNAKMAQLQEESVAMRSRPADVLLRPLAAFVNTQARKAGTTVRFSSTGGEVILDQMVIEELRGMLKTVMLSRLASDKTPSKIHLSVDREEDVVRVEISDNGGSFAKTEELDEIARSLSSRRGAFRRVSVPNGGVRIQISVPLHMVVLEGMVVRVGNIRYVVPIESIQRIHQGQDIVPVTAAGKKKMLRLGDGDLVPIQSLPRERDGMASGAPSLFVIARSHHSTVAIPVDELLGPQLVLLRPLRGALSGVRGMTGVAILSGGDVGMVVSVSRVAGTA
jgi:two-component system chemotaxis sensor kinase CheA